MRKTNFSPWFSYKSRNLAKAGERSIFIHFGFAQDLPKSIKTISGRYENLMDTIEMWTDFLAAIYGLGYKAMVNLTSSIKLKNLHFISLPCHVEA